VFHVKHRNTPRGKTTVQTRPNVGHGARVPRGSLLPSTTRRVSVARGGPIEGPPLETHSQRTRRDKGPSPSGGGGSDRGPCLPPSRVRRRAGTACSWGRWGGDEARGRGARGGPVKQPVKQGAGAVEVARNSIGGFPGTRDLIFPRGRGEQKRDSRRFMASDIEQNEPLECCICVIRGRI
jgi:hypothetical protein